MKPSFLATILAQLALACVPRAEQVQFLQNLKEKLAPHSPLEQPLSLLLRGQRTLTEAISMVPSGLEVSFFQIVRAHAEAQLRLESDPDRFAALRAIRLDAMHREARCL